MKPIYLVRKVEHLNATLREHQAEAAQRSRSQFVTLTTKAVRIFRQTTRPDAAIAANLKELGYGG